VFPRADADLELECSIYVYLSGAYGYVLEPSEAIRIGETGAVGEIRGKYACHSLAWSRCPMSVFDVNIE
jgi:hypothetical protein